MTVSTSIYDAVLTTVALAKSEATSGILPTVGDNLVNEEPIHDSTRDVDGNHHNKLTAYLAEAGVRTRPGNIVCYTFSIANLTASQTDLVLNRMSDGVDTAINSIVAWRGGSIVGATARLENDISAGGASACVVEVRDDAVKLTNLAQLILDDTTNVRQNRVNQLPGNDVAAALSLIDVVVTTDAAFAAGATPTLWVDLYVSYGGEDEAL